MVSLCCCRVGVCPLQESGSQGEEYEAIVTPNRESVKVPARFVIASWGRIDRRVSHSGRGRQGGRGSAYGIKKIGRRFAPACLPSWIGPSSWASAPGQPL